VKIVHLATFDAHGGAAVAAIRLVESLRARTHDARLIVRDKHTSHSFVETLGTATRPRPVLTDRGVSQVAWLLSERARSAKSDTPFSSDLPTYDIATHPAVRAADVIHLHWIAGFVSAYEVRRLQDLGKPVVWTLHDQFPLTGGCHYSGACRGFIRHCHRCPQLQPAAHPLASLTLAEKRGFIDPARIVLASPSRWLAACARHSALFKRARIEVVPYGIDVFSRQQTTRFDARAALGIPGDAIVLFSASVNNAEARKGHAHLIAALKHMRVRRLVKPRDAAARLRLLTAGEGATEGELEGVPCQSLGALAPGDPRIVLAYRAADVFVLPSLEDNLPNTLVEAMAAGIPVAAYRTGGVPDVLSDGVNGRVVRRGDTTALAKALADLVNDAETRERLGAAAAQTAWSAFDSPIQAAAYERIYEDEARRIGGRRSSKARSPVRSFARDPLADVPRLRALTTAPRVTRIVSSVLQTTVDEMQDVIAARGGEIRDWRRALDRADLKALELLEVIASRGGEIRDLWIRIGQMEATEQTLQGVIASRGGEIRDLRADLETLQAALVEAQTDLAGQVVRLDQRLVEASESRRTILRHMLEPAAAAQLPGARVGIFGAGEGGRKAFAACLELGCAVQWLCDNNAKMHGRTRGGVSIIAADRIPSTEYDVIVIGSAHREAIRAQLLAMGIAPERILAPDVSQPDEALVEELGRLIARD